jgi:hypothetical protein
MLQFWAALDHGGLGIDLDGMKVERVHGGKHLDDSQYEFIAFFHIAIFLPEVHLPDRGD